MGAFLCRQPNGKLCRFSTVTDTITHYNMTDEEYIEMKAEEARCEARKTIQSHLKPFEWVDEYFIPSSNMTRKEFNSIKKDMAKIDNEEEEE